MKKESKGCLGGLISWLAKVLLSLVIAVICIVLIWTWSYKNVKIFRAFVDGYPVFQFHKGKEVPKIKVDIPDDSKKSEHK